MLKNILSTLILFSSLASFAKTTFIYCSEGSPSAFNPQITTDGTSNNASAHTVYNRLVDFKYGTTTIVPSLAENWEISKDKTKYTFFLRRGVKFHETSFFKPKRDFNADDVIFSVNRQRLQTHPYHSLSGVTYDYFTGMRMNSLIKDVKKINDYTVEFTLSRPEAPFLANMAMSFMSILSKQYADQLTLSGKKANIDQIPIGTGPFVFKKYRKDSLIRFEANDDYFEGRPAIDRLVFSITSDASVRYQKLKKGECDLIIEPSPADIKSIESNKDLVLKKAAGLNVGYLAMNTTKAPFDNKYVRLAVNHALNKKAYINTIYKGFATPAKNPMPPAIWSYNEKIEDYDYNIKKARALMKKSGVKRGTEIELWTLPVTRPYNPDGKKMGELMQADLKKIGFNVKLVSFEWATYLKKARDGGHQLIQLGWSGDNGDPDNFLDVLLGCEGVRAGNNVARWCNKKYDSLIKKAKVASSQDERTKLYELAQVIFKKEVPWVPIAHSTVFRAMNKKIKGYKIDPLGGDIFKYVIKK